MGDRISFGAVICWAVAVMWLAPHQDGAEASAWPREEGKTFFSLSHAFEVGDAKNDGDYSSLFYEYGLTPDLTVGLDAGADPSDVNTSAILFLRYPVLESLSPNRFALEFGVGWAQLDDDTVVAVRPGFSWGRGYSTDLASGWLGIESSFSLYEGGATLAQVDATIGVNHDSGSLSILQLQLARPSGGELLAALAPSYIWKVSDRSAVEIGGSYRIDNGDLGLKIGYWFSH